MLCVHAPEYPLFLIPSSLDLMFHLMVPVLLHPKPMYPTWDFNHRRFLYRVSSFIHHQINFVPTREPQLMFP